MPMKLKVSDRSLMPDDEEKRKYEYIAYLCNPMLVYLGLEGAFGHVVPVGREYSKQKWYSLRWDL